MHVHSFESDLFPIITVEPLLNSKLDQMGSIKAQDSTQLGTSQSKNCFKQYLVGHLHNSVIFLPGVVFIIDIHFFVFSAPINGIL